jgi:hypothetical protein
VLHGHQRVIRFLGELEHRDHFTVSGVPNGNSDLFRRTSILRPESDLVQALAAGGGYSH